MYGCSVAFLMYILIPFCRKCGWLCIFHEEFCEKDKFAYHIVDILRNLLFFMVYLLWTVLDTVVANATTKKINEQDTKTFPKCYVGRNGKRNQQKLQLQDTKTLKM